MKTATVYRLVKADHVCPFGLKALDLLQRKGYEIEDKPLNNDAETKRSKTNSMSLPPRKYLLMASA
ncbi:hypothetical protein [uncultured Psychrobacter sp.]|uniref:hypothetical protein n=1 Tax=uncultured Psychrobacter sp. TaxID=259303 RepID=UPI00259AC7F5|nr:hypothetical protein [uncultured Psychrobacter sp.]